MISVAIVGSGPYALSLAAHLNPLGVEYRIFGPCMEAWDRHMPLRMFLKSDGFASDLYAPGAGYRLEEYCKEQGIEYAPVGLPVKRATFVQYGREFQRRYAPNLEETMIVRVSQIPGGFELETAEGERFQARRVVLAVGISHFPYFPKVLSGFSPEAVSHTFHHGPFDEYRGKHVLVIGAGASAVNAAVALNEDGAQTELMARASKINFHNRSPDYRPIMDRIRNPRSVIGVGWRSKIAVDLPLVFHAMPESLRHRVVTRHLGPAPGWFSRDGFEGHVKANLECHLQEVSEAGSKVRVKYLDPSGATQEIFVDHVIAGTGFQPFLSSLKFLDEKLSAKVRTARSMADMDSNFQSSVEGLYMTGLASAYNFGPMCRFACGARFTAKRLSRHLGQMERRRSVRVVEHANIPQHSNEPSRSVQQESEAVLQREHAG
ncbi:NAD(P)-binding domain-containing protein [Acidicapsa acidisoli]|uniref:NAD(P)-binding domain-containing protein n=1 Tax=Acidicapsa acidisoli TaxID=1615681 RepID=UPI0021DFF121|nr:NAD(P)-binding domain-containing protein [Acidicapsa acidisoli]